MKSMKLYANVHRIHNDLAALGIEPDAPLTVGQLTPFDQYHYFGTAALDDALDVLQLGPSSRVLDIGSGIGGPARYVAERTGARVTALELQADLHDVGSALTERCGLHNRVEHVCGDILEGAPARGYDAVISFLCFLHVPDKTKLFAACRAALRPGGTMYTEDYCKSRGLTASEAEDLAVKVQCPSLPSRIDYEAALAAAGFTDVIATDVTTTWRDFTASRLNMFRTARNKNVEIHGAETVNDLDDFYATVARLFHDQAVGGLKIIAR